MWARLCHLGVTRVVLCSTRHGLLVWHWIGVIWELSLKGHRWRNAHSAAVFRSPRFQENLPLRAQHGRQRTDPTRSLGGPFSGIARLSKG
jgi:hypothetical protein